MIATFLSESSSLAFKVFTKHGRFFDLMATMFYVNSPPNSLKVVVALLFALKESLY